MPSGVSSRSADSSRGSQLLKTPGLPMSLEGNTPYASARVHARYGLRLDESAWRRIEATRYLGQYLEVVRGSALAPWVANIDVAREPHAIERALRGEWRAYVRAVASWHPREWQPWLRWWSWLPVLPLIARLARPEAVPAWMLADPLCGPLAVGSPSERATALESTPLAPLALAVRAAATSIGSLWRQQAERLVPRAEPQTRQQLGILMRLLAPGVDPPPTQSAPSLLRLFRAAGESVVASGCHLTLLLLDVERLRGGLVLRTLFYPSSAEAA